MSDRLSKELLDIEKALGGDSNLPPDYYKSSDKLQWHLDYIEDLIEEGGGGSGSLKTINGQDLHGEGNISITTYQAFPETWPTDASHTTKQFCDAVNDDTSAVIGMGYFGGAKWSDKPQELSNFDIVVEVLEGPNGTKAIHLIGTSSSVYPYRWEYTYWSNGSVSGWRGVQPELISGTNIKTINNESILGSGNVDIQGGGVQILALTSDSGTLTDEQLELALSGNCLILYNNYYYELCNLRTTGVTYRQCDIQVTTDNMRRDFCSITTATKAYSFGQAYYNRPEIATNPSTSSYSTLSSIKIGNNDYKFAASQTSYLTTAPISDNTSGNLIFVVLGSEPATYYDGYYYIITESVE